MSTAWIRVNFDGASECLRLVTVDNGDQFYCDDLEGDYPYLVQVTSGPNVGDDFVGVFDLDGGEVNLPSGQSWTLVSREAVPEEVLAQIEVGWDNAETQSITATP